MASFFIINLLQEIEYLACYETLSYLFKGAELENISQSERENGLKMVSHLISSGKRSELVLKKNSSEDSSLSPSIFPILWESSLKRYCEIDSDSVSDFELQMRNQSCRLRLKHTYYWIISSYKIATESWVKDFRESHKSDSNLILINISLRKNALSNFMSEFRPRAQLPYL